MKVSFFSLRAACSLFLAVFGLFSFLSSASGSVPAEFNQADFDRWVAEAKLEAISKGIGDSLVERAFSGVKYNTRIIELDRKQPEKTKSFQQYLKSAVNKTRINKGRQLYRENRELLMRIGREYGVQPRFIVALWGIETNYGGYTGNFSIVEALATLAYDGRRSKFFRKELFNSLEILKQGHIEPENMKGSWAGAMGQSQFMPSSFLSWAQDYNKDGKRDIWQTREDVFASIANYLKNTGWDDSLTWGRKVKLPKGFDYSLAEAKSELTLPEWSRLGVKNSDGSRLPQRVIKAAIALPGGKDGDAFLVYENYKNILKWNRSDYFATAVGTLSDKFR